MEYYKLYINGKWLDSSDGQTFVTKNPATGEEVNRFAQATPSDVDNACAAAREAFERDVWSGLNPDQRADYLLKVAAIIRREESAYEIIEASETGKPICETRIVDIPYSYWAFEYFANNAREITGEVIPTFGDHGGDNLFNFTTYEPFGVAAIISPFNFPLHLMTRSLAPALMAGNTCVCKASSITPSTLALLAEAFDEAGVPSGVVNVVHGKGSVCGNALVKNAEVDIIGFTGSEEVGRKLLKVSADSPIMKKVVLELGGKGPMIVFPDCDLEVATDASLIGFCKNQGQVCSAITRLILHKDIYERYLEMLVKKVTRLKIGNILDDTTEFGSLISSQHLKEVDDDVKKAVEQGAKILCGGKRYDVGDCKNGNFYEPTILTNVTPEMECFQKEIFGPVLVVTKFETAQEGIDLANNTTFGLGANVFSQNMKKAYWVSKKLNAGSVWVNLCYGAQLSCPFGGNRNSGQGREYGMPGLKEYLKIKNNCWGVRDDGDSEYCE
ncbi:MAG: aldehyde dehydrogenase [Deltaproteobacteria bacterium]|nr:aldehyde dehydrogenase [Deltaproteobacteria bacterium]